MEDRRETARERGTPKPRRLRGGVTIRRELCNDPALEVMIDRLSAALGTVTREEAVRLLMQLGAPRRTQRPAA